MWPRLTGRPANSESLLRQLASFLLAAAILNAAFGQAAEVDIDHFEKRVRPLLAEKCWKCHGVKKQEGGLRLDSGAHLRKGGDSGQVVMAKNPAESLLLTAVRQTTDLKMPPEEKLTPAQVAHLEKWIAAGAVWPDDPTRPAGETNAAPITLIEPNATQLAESLQLWLKADALGLQNDQPVVVWPDHSGNGRDLSITAGVRPGGVGTAPQFIKTSNINGQPAVRFREGNGLAGSPDHLVDVNGDAAATMIVVCKLERHDMSPPYDNLLMIGNPAWPGDPGGPRAFYLEIDRSVPRPQLDLGGGWSHDVSLGEGSAELVYSQPRVVTVTKTPGPMTEGAAFFFDGRPSRDILKRELTGTDVVPDVQHREDFGVAIGKTMSWAGSIAGDISEVIIYNRVLTDAERRGVEAHLMSKYNLLTEEMIAASTREFSDDEKSHWSFQPVKKPLPPVVANADEIANPIDRFILAKLEAAGLKPTPLADPRTLIRRVTYDLIGLPPTPDEISAFEQESLRAPHSSFRNLVDRLLASPHYGERWARHWLDVVRYADTTANDGNFVMRYAYRYRDYVANAFNQDKPYDQFIVEQLAGDLLPPHDDALVTAERIIATGFLMIGPKALAETDKEQVKMDIADEQLDVVGRAMMGLTIACARCHDHKFDPILTVDYYSLAGIFRSTEVFADLQRNASMWMEYKIPFGSAGEVLDVMAPKDGVPRNLRVHLRGSRFRLGETAPRRFLQVLAGSGHSPLPTTNSGRLELARWIASPQHPLTARVMVNRIWQGHFGVGLVSTSDNFGTRGQLPSHPAMLDWLAARFIESGWSVKEMHRSILNSRTYRQSAGWEMRSGESSDSIPHPELRTPHSVDPDNRLLWKAPRRRLDAEQLRDSLLAISGELDAHIAGGELISKLYESAQVLDKDRGVASAATINSRWEGFDSRRRSLYLPVVRNGLPDALVLFDAADGNSITAVRNETTVSSQAAFMLNNPFVIKQAEAFARHVLAAREDDASRVKHTYLLVVGREPSEDEVSAAIRFIADYRASLQNSETTAVQGELSAWRSYCQLMFCLNEFLYVE
ncbi:MAG: hypothetical protein CMJ64_04420 [Planctomycetaceae bacterium]|nr:hypothetical protein [Planctomycetaceae bacterium]